MVVHERPFLVAATLLKNEFLKRFSVFEIQNCGKRFGLNFVRREFRLLLFFAATHKQAKIITFGRKKILDFL